MKITRGPEARGVPRGGELGTGQGRTAASPLPRAGPCAPRITSQPPPLPPRLAQRTAQLELPCGHMPKALSLPLWMDWRGVKPLHQAADLRRKGDLPSQGARSQSSPPQERGGVCSQPVSLPLSRAHPAGTVWFRQDGGRSYLAQRCPDSHPGPPQTAFNISTGKFKVEAIFFFAPIPELRSGLWVDVKPSTTL